MCKVTGIVMGINVEKAIGIVIGRVIGIAIEIRK